MDSLSGELAAWMLVIISFLFPAFFRDLRSCSTVFYSYNFVLLLHQVVAFSNAYVMTTFGAALDAASFHRLGVERALSGELHFGIGGYFYENFLGVIYYYLGPSHMLGEQISVIAFSFTCVLLLKICDLFSVFRYRASCLLFFGALPTAVLLGSVTLRESFQVMFFILAVYAGMKMLLEGGLNVYFLVLLFSSVLMGLFHNGLLPYAVFLIVIFMFWTLRSKSRFWRVKKMRLLALLLLPAIIAGTAVLANSGLTGMRALSALNNMNLLKSAAEYRSHSTQARATYSATLDLSNPINAVRSSVAVYMSYLLAPFPWQVRDLADIYAFVEVVFRVALLFFAIKSYTRKMGVQKQMFKLMLILFFSMTFLWSMGVTNYGTAMRHHLLDWWILLVLGLPALLDKTRMLLRNILGSFSTRKPRSMLGYREK